ncbi:UNVERIFIED_ORG: hypothetical protein BCL66_103258 [Martelella mediterranea]
MAKTLINADELDAIALGGAFLGTGGGGDPYIGKLMAKAALSEKGPVTLIDPADVADDALCVPVFMMGAPTVMLEKLPSGAEIMAALAQLEAYLGKKATALMCVEAGGLNSTIPFAVAAATGLPLIDGDGMGRAFPELQMVSFTMSGIRATPLVLADDKGNSVLINAVDNLWTERLARADTVQMGGAALVAAYSMTGAQMRDSILPGTMTMIRDIGKTLMAERKAHRHPGAALRARFSGHHLFTGRVVDIERRTVGGFARGRAIVKGTDDFAGRQFSVDFQNEFLVARDDAGTVMATTPDLICALDADAGMPVTTEQMRYGLLVEFTGLPADAKWRTEAGLKLVGPGYFGYDHDFMPVEKLNDNKKINSECN